MHCVLMRQIKQLQGNSPIWLKKPKKHYVHDRSIALTAVISTEKYPT